MSIDFNFKRIGQTHLFQSDSFFITKKELEYIYENESVEGGDIHSLIESHELIPLEQRSDRRIKFTYWPVRGTDDKWAFDIVKPNDAILDIPSRLIESLIDKKPIPMKKDKSGNKEEEAENTKEAKVWITYAWDDNKDKDVDFIAQELGGEGLEVKLDRWNINAGKRLWEQIEQFIQNEDESDCWILYATENSLGSEPCKEEFAYALDRALDNRGSDYPVIGLFPSAVDKNLIPAGIKTRLYVSTSDPDWKDRIIAAAEGRSPKINRQKIDPYVVRNHTVEGGHLIEIRPRAGSWYPFTVGIPLKEKDLLGNSPLLLPGALNEPPKPSGGFILEYRGSGEAETSDGSKWMTVTHKEEATPAKSFYLFVTSLPTKLIFGSSKGKQHVVTDFKS